jgi:hypothetical protein
VLASPTAVTGATSHLPFLSPSSSPLLPRLSDLPCSSAAAAFSSFPPPHNPTPSLSPAFLQSTLAQSPSPNPPLCSVPPLPLPPSLAPCSAFDSPLVAVAVPGSSSHLAGASGILPSQNYLFLRSKRPRFALFWSRRSKQAVTGREGRVARIKRKRYKNRANKQEILACCYQRRRGEDIEFKPTAPPSSSSAQSRSAAPHRSRGRPVTHAQRGPELPGPPPEQGKQQGDVSPGGGAALRKQ